jgi:RHS repeat-associated protein
VKKYEVIAPRPAIGSCSNILVAELSGRTVTYGYDDLYRLTSETVASDPRGNNGQVSYTFDNVGNRLQRTSTLPAVPATSLLNYDANDRTTTDPYDADGNLLSSGAGANVYDFENRLVQAGGVKLVYDGDGNRVKESVATTTTSYLVADQNLTGYAQVLDELQGGTVTRTYSYGLSLISQRLTANGQGLSFYGFDGHGSVRFLTNSTGAVTDTYDYDAYGNLIAQTGTTPNNYLFAGEQFDSTLGIYYNRTRYYDQRQGRFWTMDTWEGHGEEPISLHKYTYIGNSPVNRRDPSGRDFDLGSTLSALQTQATLFVQNTATRFAVAFAAGGTALGTFYNELGAVAENIATAVAELLQAANPEVIQSIEQDVQELEEGGGQRFIDLAIRTSDKIKDILIEVKYAIPTEGEALTRLIGQVNAALNSGNEVIVWALKSPTAAELENLAEELGESASRIQVLSGPENLYNYIQSLLK